MSKPEEKKCPRCGTLNYDYSCLCGLLTGKRLPPSQSCEHDEKHLYRDHFTNETQSKTAHESCPFCKPTAVEPSVESIAFALVHKFSIYTEDGTFFSNNEPNEPKKLELLIAEALRNERNRHG